MCIWLARSLIMMYVICLCSPSYIFIKGRNISLQQSHIYPRGIDVTSLLSFTPHTWDTWVSQRVHGFTNNCKCTSTYKNLKPIIIFIEWCLQLRPLLKKRSIYSKSLKATDQRIFFENHANIYQQYGTVFQSDKFHFYKLPNFGCKRPFSFTFWWRSSNPKQEPEPINS